MTNDLPSVGTEDASKMAGQLEVGDLTQDESDMAANMLRALVSERDELASRVRELERAAVEAAQPEVMGCRLCGADEPFTGSCGGGRNNPISLCFAATPTESQPAEADERSRPLRDYLAERIANMTPEQLAQFEAARVRIKGALSALTAPAQAEPVAWLYKTHAGDAQAFTNEPPPRLKELCQPLYATPPATAAVPSDAERKGWEIRKLDVRPCGCDRAASSGCCGTGRCEQDHEEALAAASWREFDAAIHATKGGKL